jgi:glycosyltransferase involved in cell wall biosynthesis
LYLTDEYVPADARAMRAVLGVIGRPLRRWDQRAAAGAQRYVVNSSRSRERVRATYGIEAEVVHPPPAITVDGPQRPVADVQPGFVLCVSRLVEYKNVRALVDAAARRPNLALVVVGSGPLRAELEALAPSNATFLGAVADDQLRWLYDQCAALVGPAYEEFGLTPLEAAAFGKPTIALRYGGYLDTVQEDATGLFFDEPTPDAIGAVLDRMDEVVWDPSRLRQHAESFAEARFIDRMRAIVDLEARLGGFGALDPLD